jgi:hypothetical protein
MVLIIIGQNLKNFNTFSGSFFVRAGERTFHYQAGKIADFPAQS